jgi:hypothetical protein
MKIARRNMCWTCYNKSSGRVEKMKVYKRVYEVSQEGKYTRRRYKIHTIKHQPSYLMRIWRN